VPDPVYEKAVEEADKRDISIGAVISNWMEKAEAWSVVHREIDDS